MTMQKFIDSIFELEFQSENAKTPSWKLENGTVVECQQEPALVGSRLVSLERGYPVLARDGSLTVYNARIDTLGFVGEAPVDFMVEPTVH